MSIIDKIAALRKKIPENGATEDEALASLALADKLMAKHGITEEQLNKVEYAAEMSQKKYGQTTKAIHPATKFCVVTIGKFCETKVWWDGYLKETKFFGFNGDVEMAEFLYDLIRGSMDRGWKEFLRDNPKDPYVSRHTQYWSFMMGMGGRLNKKMHEIMEQRQVDKETANALIVKKMAVVEAGFSALTDITLKHNKQRGIHADKNAYARGQIAGDKVNLSRPIRSGNMGPRQLKG